MTWALIFLLAAVLFFNRYLLLEPRLPIRLPGLVQQALHYAAPCLLTAITGNIILNGHALADLPSNPYFYATAFSVVCAYFVRHMLLSVLISMGGFYVILSLF